MIRQLLITSLALYSLTGQTSQLADDRNIEQLYHKLENKPMTLSDKIDWFSQELLGKPYLFGPLGEGSFGEYDQKPLYRFDAFDCETFVDTVLALALANNVSSFKQTINNIRYKQGKVSFLSRNHFTDLDWNKNNQKKGYLIDITTTFHDEHKQPVAKKATAIIDKPSWYRGFTIQRISLAGLSDEEKQEKLNTLIKTAQNLPIKTITIDYIPFTALFNGKNQPNTYLFRQIPQGSIIEIIRPNWLPTPAFGTHLNVSHLGFAIWKNGKLYFREASSTEHQVVDVPLVAYLLNAKKSPSTKGINIQVVNMDRP